MRNRISSIVLYALGLCAIAHGLKYTREEMYSYYKCWTFATCFSDGEGAQNQANCFKNVGIDGLQHFVDYLDGKYHVFKNKTLVAAFKEYCDSPDTKRREVYHDIIDSSISLEKEACDDPKQAVFCEDLGKTIDCTFDFLEKEFPDKDCDLTGQKL